MKKHCLHCLAAMAVFYILAAGQAQADEATRQKLFQRVFGDAARPDPEMRKKVLAAPPGQRCYVDKNHDGKPEEVWFIDTDPRHAQADRPILVRAIDRDGDLKMGGEPDTDSDLYIADWKADGTVDAVLEYLDTDHDNKVDEMVMYFDCAAWLRGQTALAALWSRDVGHDHRLLYGRFLYLSPDGLPAALPF